MIFFRISGWLVLFLVLGIGSLQAKKTSQDFYRDFWFPTYLIQRLDYCNADGKECGHAIATCYCKMMGYAESSGEKIDYNVGMTNYLSTRLQCKGWGCNGFKWITCLGVFSHTPKRSYFYRSKRYVFPRFDHYRVDWCYENAEGCGKRAAFSFCRRMGYSHAQSYQKQSNVAATQALGNQKLCFGPTCEGFSEITCYR